MAKLAAQALGISTDFDGMAPSRKLLRSRDPHARSELIDELSISLLDFGLAMRSSEVFHGISAIADSRTEMQLLDVVWLVHKDPDI